LVNENNFDWKVGTTRFSRNVAWTNSLFFLGMALSNATATLYLRYNMRKVLMTFSILGVIGVLMHCCFTNEIPFFAARLILGYCCGINRSISGIF